MLSLVDVTIFSSLTTVDVVSRQYVTMLFLVSVAYAYNDDKVAQSQSPPVAAPSASPAMFRQFPLRGSNTRMFVGLIGLQLSLYD